MALRFGRGEGHNHGGRRLAYLAAVCTVALLLPAVGIARTTEGTSTVSGSARTQNVINVNTTADLLPEPGECIGTSDCSLRQAIDAASQVDTDTIVLGPFTYGVTRGSLVIGKSLTILGVDPSATTINGSRNFDDSNSLNRIMTIVSEAPVSIIGLTMTGGVDQNDEFGSSGPTLQKNGGGAIFNSGSTVFLANVAFVNNNVNTPVGGAVATTGNLTMTDVTFTNNGAALGGALRVRSGTAIGVGLTFNANDGEFGGTIYVDEGGVLNLTNSTIVGGGNASTTGGGIKNVGGSVNLLNVTLADNVRGSLETDSGTTAIQNTIIGAGYSGNANGDCVGLAPLSLGHNIDADGSCTLTGAGDHTGDPLLAGFANWGGPTKTDALLAASPAIDAGSDSCPVLDQRHYDRSGNQCDIGAFEYIAGAHASFMYDPQTPLDGENVTFTSDSSTTNPATLSYFWDFGDGTTSTDPHPTHAFAAPNYPVTFTVTLQIADSFHSVDRTSQTITVDPTNFAPIASFSFGAASPNEPVQFDASASHDPDGSIVNYDWNWGDGSDHTSGGDQIMPTHTYGSAGTYTVTLTVTDDGEQQDTVSHDVTVTAPAVTHYYVDTNWLDMEDGTHVTGPQGQQLTIGTDAFGEIHDALFAANQGDPDSKIHVAAGTYTERGTLSLEQDGDQLIGAGRDVTHVNLGVLSVDGAGQVVQGFDFIGSGTWTGTACSPCSRSPLIRLNGDSSDNGENDVPQNALILDNRISGGKRGVAFAGGESADFPSSGSQVVDNEFFHNVTAVFVDSGSDNLILGNNIHDNGGTSSDNPQAAVLIVDEHDNQPTGNVVSGNTIANSSSHGISVRTSDNTIVGNTISASGLSYPTFKESSGIELVDGSNDHVDDNFISGNTITGSAFAGIKIGASADGGQSLPNDNGITGNTITGTLHGGVNGSSANPGAGGTAILLTGGGATNTTITGNTLGPNSGYGVLQEGQEGYSTGTIVHQNFISGNALGGIRNNDAAPIDAQQNWWGNASGPSAGGPGSGDSVSPNVTFDSWLTCPPGITICNQPPPPLQQPPSPPAANQPPHASFVLTPPGTAGSLQVTVDASGSSDPDGTIASYAWSFGDGTSATSSSTTHTYAAAGTFTITLTVTDNNGATSTTTQQVTVPVPGAPAPPVPPPVKGVSVDVLPFIGTVLVNGLPLVAGQQIPYGAIVDTTHGTIFLQAISPTGQLDAAYFAGAIFKVLYTPAGLTQLVLQGGDFSVCTAKSKRHAAVAAAKPTKKTVVRSLWGNGHGQFVTKGKYAAATVRGTIWNTQDRCDGTFVNVQRGVVSVLDLVRNKTKSVTAGHSFLVAKP